MRHRMRNWASSPAGARGAAVNDGLTAIDQAIAAAQHSGECRYDAQLYGIKADLQIALGCRPEQAGVYS